MPRKSKKPVPLGKPLDAEAAADRLAAGKRVWVDLVQAAQFYGMTPDAFLVGLRSGELVASRKPGMRGKAWRNFVLASDTLLAWAEKRGLQPAQQTVN